MSPCLALIRSADRRRCRALLLPSPSRAASLHTRQTRHFAYWAAARDSRVPPVDFARVFRCRFSRGAPLCVTRQLTHSSFWNNQWAARGGRPRRAGCGRPAAGGVGATGRPMQTEVVEHTKARRRRQRRRRRRASGDDGAPKPSLFAGRAAADPRPLNARIKYRISQQTARVSCDDPALSAPLT